MDEAIAVASKPKQGRPFAALYGLGDETRFGEHLDRPLHGSDHVRFGVGLAFATDASSGALNDMKRHRASEVEHALHLSLPLASGTPIVVIFPEDKHGSSRRDGGICARRVDAGSLSGAARQLRIGQPAVSKTIAQLEDRLGARLLLRSTRRLTPTEAGRNFYERAKRAIEEWSGRE